MKMKGTVVALALLVGLAGVAGDAMAERANDITYFYYSDASHTTIVGNTEYMCRYGSQTTGDVTQWSTSVTVPCENGQPTASPYPAVPTEYITCWVGPKSNDDGFLCR